MLSAESSSPHAQGLALPYKFAGDSTERVDTRVLQIIYRMKDQTAPLYVGQQMDVYIEAPVASNTFGQHSGIAAGGG